MVWSDTRQRIAYESRRNGQNHVIAIPKRIPNFGADLYFSGVDLHIAQVAGVMAELFDILGIGFLAKPPLDTYVVFGEDFDERGGPASSAHHRYTSWLSYFHGVKKLRKAESGKNTRLGVC